MATASSTMNIGKNTAGLIKNVRGNNNANEPEEVSASSGFFHAFPPMGI